MRFGLTFSTLATTVMVLVGLDWWTSIQHAQRQEDLSRCERLDDYARTHTDEGGLALLCWEIFNKEWPR